MTGWGVHDLVVFLSTLSLRRATWRKVSCALNIEISIHALLAESDGDRAQPILHFDISIHALLAESDTRITALFDSPLKFLSTLSLRRATSDRQRGPQHFGISIHALLAESDLLR